VLRCVHSAVDFFNQINMLYGTITEFCTEESCPVMSAGRKYEYHWADGTTVKKPIKCSAPKYIDYLMSWVQCQLDDESLFPSRIGQCLSVCLSVCLCLSLSLSVCLFYIMPVPLPSNRPGVPAVLKFLKFQKCPEV